MNSFKIKNCKDKKCLHSNHEHFLTLTPNRSKELQDSDEIRKMFFFSLKTSTEMVIKIQTISSVKNNKRFLGLKIN
jgi:hypothetical protein